MTKRPLILVTNDDGANASGLKKLADIMRKLGDVVLISTEQPMSGMAHAVTVNVPLRPRLIHQEEGYTEYISNGTPVDNVKLCKHTLLEDLPDIVVSGINHGSNSAINIIYSGTMGAALEAAIDGIPSIGFSLMDYSADADFSHVEAYVEKITSKVLEEGLPEGISLNVNIPKNCENAIKGIKVVRQARARWVEEFEERKDPFGRTYYWLAGHFANEDTSADTDENVLADNYVSVVPVQFDFTAHHLVDQLSFD